jgi:hypothetical protein
VRDVIRPRGRARRRAVSALAALGLVMPLVWVGVASAASVMPTPAGAWSPWKACPKKAQAKENCAAVRAILRTSDGTVFLAGDFTKLRNHANGATKDVHNLAAVDDNGTPVAGFATHKFNGVIYTLSTDGTSLFAGGAFTTVDGTASAHLAKFALPGLARQPITTGFNGTIFGSVFAGSKLYVGGKFTSVQGSSRGNLAAVDPATGTLDPNWIADAELIPGDAPPNDEPHNNTPVRALAVSPDGARIYVGGDFDLFNGASQPALVALDPTTGALLPDFNNLVRFFLPTGVQTMTIVPVDASDGRNAPGVVVAAGGMLNRAFLFNTDGMLARIINTDGDVQAAAVKGTTVYFGGHFTCISVFGCPTEPIPGLPDERVTRVHLVALDYNSAWLSTSNIDTDFAPEMQPSSPPYYFGVYVLQAYGDSLYAGGVFKNVVVNGKTYPNSKFVRFGPSIGPPPPPPTPDPGTSLFADDFVTNDASRWSASLIGAGMTVADGAASGATTGKIAYLGSPLSAKTTKVEAAAKVTVTKLDPKTKVVLLRLTRVVSGVRKGVADVFVRPNGVLGVRNEVGGVDWVSKTVLTKGVQHTLDLKLTAAGKSGKVVLSLDGAPITALTKTGNLGTAAVDGVQIGDTTKRSYTISWDDVSVLAG